MPNVLVGGVGMIYRHTRNVPKSIITRIKIAI